MRPLKIISAGAGSGKTYRLTEELTALLKAGEVRPDGIIATTFTKKAAAELKERVRVKLLQEGLTKEANELTNALIGTVHGLGVKLLQRFAFEAGVSPAVEIIPDDDHQRLFNLSMAAIIPVSTIERFELLSNRLGLGVNGNPHDWRKEIRQVVEVIRANDFSPEDIAESKAKSWSTFAEFLPAPNEISSAAANNRLATLLSSTQELLENNEADGTKTTLSAAQKLRGYHRELKQRGYLSWPDWAILSKFSKRVGAKSRDLAEDLEKFASDHPQLPHFQSDIRDYIELIFNSAESAIREYDTYKKKRGQIDYTDMEVLVLRLLDNETVRATLSEELDLLMVDEFQDTSPIQLALFLRLSHLAKQSIWVGDPKQSIYGFRGAEPGLMAAVIRQAGGIQPENIQEHSWRSREDIVYATNALFTKAFPEVPAKEVRLIPKRTRNGDGKLIPSESPEQSELPGLWHWHYELDGKGRISNAWSNDMIARSVRALLDNPPAIRPKGSKEYRPLRAEDIAILCRSNYGCTDVARALQNAGIPAALARHGLMATAESVLLLASLKYMLNGEDSLSVAEIMLLATRKPLQDIIDHRLGYLDTVEAFGHSSRLSPWGHDDPYVAKLDELREHTQEFSPAELLNHLLEQLELRRIVAAWGNGEQRLSNIDEMRRLVLAYEENCHRLQQAASIGGFLLMLNQMAADDLDQQGAGERPEAVNVLTYHKSKGLEWPVVICHNLDQNLRAELWGRAIISNSDTIDPDRPLANRWLRYWVNPYGRSGSGLSLNEALAGSEWQQQKTAEARAEEARLLYVGITRARDHLVFPTTKNGAAWVDRVYRSEKEPVLDPYSDATPFTWDGHEIDKQTVFRTEPRTLPVAEARFTPVPFISGERIGRREHTIQTVDASRMSEVVNPSRIGLDRIVHYLPDLDLPPDLRTTDFGRVLLHFIAGDLTDAPEAERSENADYLLGLWSIPEVATAEQLMAHSSAFHRWAEDNWPGEERQQFRRLAYRDGAQYFDATIDWIIGPDNDRKIVQNLILGGSNWRKKMGAHLLSLLYLARVADQLLPGGIGSFFVHLPLQGAVVEIDWKTAMI